MNDLQRIDLKVFATSGGDIPPEEFIGIFQKWIQEHSVEGVLIDVADYSHMHEGAGIVLVGHERNHSVDYREGRMGLLVKQRHALEGGLSERLTQILGFALKACVLLEDDPALAGRIQFNGGAVEVVANDRLHMPNETDSATAFHDAVAAWAGEVFGGDASVEQKLGDLRNRVTEEVRAGAPISARDLLARLPAGNPA